MILSRELGKRIWGGSTNTENGGGGVSSDAIAGLLTGYAKESWVDEHYISIDFFSRLFQAHGTENGSEIDVMPNDLETTITSVESMFGFWTNLYISALGSNGAAPAGISLGMLTDVAISGTPSAGQVLTYDVATQKWVNGNAQAGATTLANLTDVLLTSPSDYEFLMYQSSKWVNSALKTINGQSLVGSGNISVGGGASGNYLPLSGGMMSGTINYYNSNTGLYYLGTGNTPAGKIIHTAGGNKTIALISRDGDEGGILVGTDCTTIYGAGDGGYVFKVYDSDGITDLSGNFPNNKCFVAVEENYGKLLCRQIYSYKEGNNTLDVYGVNERGAIRLSYDSNIYHQLAIVNTTSESYNYIEFPTTKGFYLGFRGGSAPFVVKTNGNIGIGDSNPAYRLEISGSCRVSSHLLVASTDTSYELCVGGTIYATGAITALSDMRDKTVVENIIDMNLEKIANAPVFMYQWKDKKADSDLHIGSSAQYWKTVLPEAVLTAKDEKGTLSMQYGVAALVSAIITARKVVDHERRITELEKENERLKKEISQLRLN